MNIDLFVVIGLIFLIGLMLIMYPEKWVNNSNRKESENKTQIEFRSRERKNIND